MILLGNTLYALGYVLDAALSIMVFIVIARAILSWVNPDPFNPIVRFLVSSSEPLLRPIKRHLPSFGGLDLSPIVLILAIYFVKIAVAQSLMEYALRIKAF